MYLTAFAPRGCAENGRAEPGQRARPGKRSRAIHSVKIDVLDPLTQTPWLGRVALVVMSHPSSAACDVDQVCKHGLGPAVMDAFSTK